MSGHSKWNNIKRTKEKSDAVRGKIFTKIGRELAVIVKMGGADPSTNARLKDAIAKAKSANMPNDTIARSIAKASGAESGISYEDITYEGYGIGGSAVMVHCLTDNKNRTAGDVRHAFDKHGGSLGANGCVSYLFKQKGMIEIETEGKDLDEVMMLALDAGAKDVLEEDGFVTVVTEPLEVGEVAEKLTNAGIKVVSQDSCDVPDMYVKLEKDKQASFIKMIDMLEDLDDVQEVSHNVELEEE